MKDLTLKYEEQGREMMTKVCQNDIPGCKVTKYSKDRHAHWDMAITIKGKPYICEIKVREYKSNAYPEWYYQQDKHLQLLKLKAKADEKKNTNIFYINFFTDNAYKIWDTTNIHKTQVLTTKMTQQTTTTERQAWVSTPIYLVGLENEYQRGEIEEEIFKNHPTGDQEDITDFTNPFNR